ncbi:MAG: hypothetical protein IIZ49_00895, partial [Oscillospiraceae bacterium]|nr:hypothetical protein [Oscillospiraceae bacterium]
MKDQKKRKNIRLSGYDYSLNGVYFVTFCVKNNDPVLSSIRVGPTIGRPPQVFLTDIGVIVEQAIQNVSSVYPGVFIDQYVIMPNHVLLFFRIEHAGGRPMVGPTQLPSLSRIIAQMKGIVSKQAGRPIWQDKFY